MGFSGNVGRYSRLLYINPERYFRHRIREEWKARIGRKTLSRYKLEKIVIKFVETSDVRLYIENLQDRKYRVHDKEVADLISKYFEIYFEDFGISITVYSDNVIYALDKTKAKYVFPC